MGQVLGSAYCLVNINVRVSVRATVSARVGSRLGKCVACK